MYKIDNSMTVLLIATYIAITILLFLNLFIALFSSTVSRIEEQAEKYLLYQRAVVCLAVDYFTIKCPILNSSTKSIHDLFIYEKFEVVNHSIDFKIKVNRG